MFVHTIIVKTDKNCFMFSQVVVIPDPSCSPLLIKPKLGYSANMNQLSSMKVCLENLAETVRRHKLNEQVGGVAPQADVFY